LWRLRRKNERGFNDGFHINNGDEAKGLCDLLNNLETELTAAREELKAVTEQRDEAYAMLCRIARKGEFMDMDGQRLVVFDWLARRHIS
jgi:hypothetical protein